MKKAYYSATCTTCARIIKDLELIKKGFEMNDIKVKKITAKQLDELKEMAGSYENLFSRVAIKYKALNPKPTSEKEYRKLILEEYTFLKRPVIVLDNLIFVGSKKSSIEGAKNTIGSVRKK